MVKDKRKKHLRLVKSGKPKPSREEPLRLFESEEFAISENTGDTELLLLTGPPDIKVAIDKDAPMEVRLRVAAAVKSYTMGNKSVDYIIRKYRALWEDKL